MHPPFDARSADGFLVVKYGDLPASVAARLAQSAQLTDFDPQFAASFHIGAIFVCKDGRLSPGEVGAFWSAAF